MPSRLTSFAWFSKKDRYLASVLSQFKTSLLSPISVVLLTSVLAGNKGSDRK